MNKALALILVVFIAIPCFAGDKSSRLHFETHGYSIVALEGQSENQRYHTIIMLLPASQGFAPNVDVQIQPCAGTIDSYAALSKQQFKDGGYTIIREESPKKGVIVFEYSGDYQGKKHHYYARAEATGDKVYLVLATALDSQWKTVSPKLIACVDSFMIDK